MIIYANAYAKHVEILVVAAIDLTTLTWYVGIQVQSTLAKTNHSQGVGLTDLFLTFLGGHRSPPDLFLTFFEDAGARRNFF